MERTGLKGAEVISHSIIFILALLVAPLPARAATNRELTATQIKNGSGLLKIPTTTPTASRACVWDASSIPSASSVTSTELGYLSGATSNIQDQLNAAAGGINQLTGDVTAGPGTGSQAATIGALKVTNGMLAGSIAASKLVGSDIATVGTVTSGTWNGTAVGPTFGGTGQSTVTAGDLLYGSASNVWSKLAVGTLVGQGLFVQSTGVPGYEDLINPKIRQFLYEEFDRGFTGGSSIFGSMIYGVSGTGANVTFSTSQSSSTNIGIADLETGTTTAGYAFINNHLGGAKTIYLGGGIHIFEAVVKLSALSDATDTYAVSIGLEAGTNAINSTDGVYFGYTHSLSSGQWRAYSSKSSSDTVTASGVAASTSAFQRLTIIASADLSQALYYVDGSLVATHDGTNIPLSTTALRHFGIIVKSAGTTTRHLYVDYIKHMVLYTTAR